MRVSVEQKPFPRVRVFLYDAGDCAEIEITRICFAADDSEGWADVIDIDKRDKISRKRVRGPIRIVPCARRNALCSF